MQLTLFDDPAEGRDFNGLEADVDDRSLELADLFTAYRSCRRHKRRSASALAFEVDYEANLLSLWDEIETGTYRPGSCAAFIVDEPVLREVFAAPFRDRVVHHLIVGELEPHLEREFIHDAYACRPGKGTLFGIRRLERFIRRCSHGYTRDCYVLKLDIQAFFTSIDRELLMERLDRFVRERFPSRRGDDLARLCRVVVCSDPTARCHWRSPRSAWDDLPRDKSLFGSKPGTGLPIGNLTSQVLANFFLNDLDHFVKSRLGIRFYGRYVDDMVFVHESREHLTAVVPAVRAHLADRLRLRLHPKKIWLQHYSHGVPYLGAVVKPGRTYIGARTKGGFRAAIRRHNDVVAADVPSVEEGESFAASMNSYLGLLAHHDTYRLRRSLLRDEVDGWWSYASTGTGLRSVRVDPTRRPVRVY